MRMTFAIEHHVTCAPPCGADVPVNGVVAEVACVSCRRAIALDDAYWKRRFGREFRPWNARKGDGDASELRAVNGIDSYLRYGVEDAACNACGARLDLELAACGGCGAPIAKRAAGARDQLIDANATLVVGEEVGGTMARRVFVVCEYDDDAWREYRWRRVEERRLDAEGDLGPALLARLAADHDTAVRQAVAANAATPPEALAQLAEDDHPHVRAAAAGNHHTPAKQLAAIASTETVPEVMRALVGQHALPPAVVDALATSYLAAHRVLAVKRAELTPDRLRELAHDREDEVRAAAKQKLGGNWFTRLFGG